MPRKKSVPVVANSAPAPKNNIKVSVVVPCYKVEKYIRQAHQSLANQTLKEIEIIYVHDGSPDGTLKILREIEKNDSRVVVIDQKNSGVGRAINVGLDACHGEYVAHMDADDYFSIHMLEDLYQRSKKYDLDICISNFFKFTGEYETFRATEFRFQTDNFYYNKVFSPDDFLDTNSPDYLVGFAWCQTWSTLYRREFLDKNAIRWNEKVAAYNDLGFWFQTRTLCKRLMYVDKPYYFYRQDNANSTINNLDKLFKDRITESLYVKDKLVEHGIFEKFKSFYYDSKFRAYTGFVLPKIGFDMKMKFIEHIYNEFSEYMAQGELDSKAFTPWRWKQLQKILANPKNYFEEYVKSNYKISVILLIENAEEYIYEVIRSFINSQLPEIEIICILNGTTDKTPDILKGLANSDSRITTTQLTEKIPDNEAYNMGIDIAHSAYVLFSKCSLEQNYHPFLLKDVYDTAFTNNADVCVFRTVIVDVKSTIKEKDNTNAVNFPLLPEDKTVFTEKDLPGKTFLGVIEPNIFDKIFKKEFLISKNIKIKNSTEEFTVKALSKGNVSVDWRAPLTISVETTAVLAEDTDEDDYKKLLNYVISLTKEVQTLKTELNNYKAEVVNNYISTNDLRGRVKFAYIDDRKISCAKLFTINLAAESWANGMIEVSFMQLLNNKKGYETAKLFLNFASMSKEVNFIPKIINAEWVDYNPIFEDIIFYELNENSIDIYCKFTAQNEGIMYKIENLTSRKTIPTLTDILDTGDYTAKQKIPQNATFITDRL